MKIVAPFAAVMTIILLIFAAVNMSSINGVKQQVRDVRLLKPKKLKALRTDINALESSRKDIRSLRTKISDLQAKIAKLEDENAGPSEDDVARIIDQRIQTKIARAQDDLRNQFNRQLRDLNRKVASLGSSRAAPRRTVAAANGAGKAAAPNADDPRKQQDETIRRGTEAIMDRVTERMAERANLTDDQTNGMRKMMGDMGKVWQEVMAGNMTQEEAREKTRELRSEFEKTLTDEQKESYQKMRRGWRGGRGRRNREGDRNQEGDGGHRRHRDRGGDDF